ncbi:MAG: hypothetical protein RLZZ621_37 [Gemmatimonadota bacterium]
MRKFALLLGIVALAACDKNATQIDDITAPLSGARVKFFNFGINAPAVNFYANADKVTAISSTTGVESTVGVGYGSAASGGFYRALPPGQYTFAGKIAATVDKDLAVSAIPGTLADGKAYSVYMSGFYNTATKLVEGFVVEDNFPTEPDYTQALVRFVNASPNSVPMQLVARNPTTLEEKAIGSPIAYKAGGTFVGVPVGGYDLLTKTAAGATVITRTAVAFSAGRVYTITARGDMTVTSTTATNRPFLDNTANR